MLRLRRRETDVLLELSVIEQAWNAMTTQHAAEVQPTETMELRRPGAPHDVVRLGPTVTQVAGFGAHADVVDWLAEAMAATPQIIRADAFDDVFETHRRQYHLAPDERQTLVDRVLDLADRAREIEAALAKMTPGDDPDLDGDWASAALALADEWDACSARIATDHTEAASREIDLRARTAEMLGRLPGADPAGELRNYAEAIVHRQEHPDTAVTLRSELDRVEAEGRALVARIDDADGAVTLPAVRVHEMFDGGAAPVIIDGDLLDAVAPSVYDLLLDKLRSEADRRRVVIVYDDTTLDAWLATVHGASVWTTGHLHLVHTHAGDAELDEVRSRAGEPSAGRVSKVLGPCEKHPTALTRLTCNSCKRPCCSACLVRVNTKQGLLCIDCALERGTGVKRRGR